MANIFDQVVHKITQPVSGTVHAAKQLAGLEPARRFAIEGPTTQYPRAAAKQAYQMSAFAPFMEFATNPNAQNLLMAMLSAPGTSGAVALGHPKGAWGKALRKTLDLAHDEGGMKAGKEFEDLANKNMLPFTHDIRSQLLNMLPDTSKGIKRGGIHKVPATSNHGVFVDDRTAIIQDPESGTMFAAPGVIHGDLIKHVNENYEGFPTGFQDWLQHEVYSPTKFTEHDPEVPARLMFGGVNGRLDTPQATISRAALVKRMREVGINTGNPSELSNVRKSLLDQMGPRGAEILDEILARNRSNPRHAQTPYPKFVPKKKHG
jgi:hypothetical protein